MSPRFSEIPLGATVKIDDSLVVITGRDSNGTYYTGKGRNVNPDTMFTKYGSIYKIKL